MIPSQSEFRLTTLSAISQITIVVYQFVILKQTNWQYLDTFLFSSNTLICTCKNQYT